MGAGLPRDLPPPTAGEERARGERADRVGEHGDLGAVDLTLAALAAQLARRLDAEVGAAATADVQRAAVRVGGQRSAEARVALGHEGAGLTLAAEPERF